MKSVFGERYALERRLPIALQFATFTTDQRATLKKAKALPKHIETMMDSFEKNLTPEQQQDPRYAYRVYLIQKTANRAPSADIAVELVPPGSEIAEKFSIALKEVEKKKYLPSEIVSIMKKDGWNLFTLDRPPRLWKSLSAKDPAKGYGTFAVGRQWCWYETWLTRVREECDQHPDNYKGIKAAVVALGVG